MALQNNPSEWQTGESDPNDFTVDALQEVLANADDSERTRIKEADQRETVQNWEPDSGEDNPPENPPEELTTAAPAPTKYEDLPDPSDENYDALQDPSVPSSVIAEVVATELKVLDGKSPTLDACREAYKETHSDNE